MLKKSLEHKVREIAGQPRSTGLGAGWEKGPSPAPPPSHGKGPGNEVDSRHCSPHTKTCIPHPDGDHEG